MTHKRTLLSLLPLVAAALVAASVASASSSTTGASLVIRHQVRGCHSWAVNGSPFKASQTITLARGATLTIANNDMMPHTFVQLAGPATVLKHVVMGRMGAIASATFRSTGTYRFTTKAGEDYMSGVKTIGADNVLTLVVHVR